MVSSLGSVNSVKVFNAMNAFKPKSIEQPEQIVPEVSEGIDTKDSSDVLQNQNVDEIRNIAQSVGDDDISDEDIKYGLTYGRSVIADYSA